MIWILLFYQFLSGVLVPGGFGSRGAEGKILAARWARKNKKPYLGKAMFLAFLHVTIFFYLVSPHMIGLRYLIKLRNAKK